MVTTRKSFVFRISVTISAGRATPNVSSFTTSRGMFSRASPVIFSNEDDRNGVVSIALKGNELFLLAWRVLQRWSLSQDNQKVSFQSNVDKNVADIQLAHEYDIVDLIGEGVFGDEWKQQKVKLEINDIAKLDDSLVALVGWVGDESASTSDREQRTYGLAVLENSGKTIIVSRFIDLAYTPVSYHFSSITGTKLIGRQLEVILDFYCPLGTLWRTFDSQIHSSCYLSHRVSHLPHL